MGLNIGGILKGIGRIGLGVATGFVAGGPLGGAIGGLGAALGGGRRSDRRGGTNTIPAGGGGFTGLVQPRVPDLGFGPNRGFGGTNLAFGGGGDFGAGGAGAGFGVPSFGVPAVGGAGVLDMCPQATMIPLQVTARAAHIPGYVVVTLPASCGGAAGQKMHVLKEVARKMGWWKATPRPLLSAADARCLRRSRAVENKLVRLTKRHTKYKVVTGGTRTRNPVRKRR